MFLLLLWFDVDMIWEVRDGRRRLCRGDFSGGGVLLDLCLWLVTILTAFISFKGDKTNDDDDDDPAPASAAESLSLLLKRNEGNGGTDLFDDV